MRLALPAFAALAWLLSGCSTPYRPPVVVAGGPDFDGVAKIVAESGDSRVDLVLVHGMCTQKEGVFEKKAKALADRLNGVVLAERGTVATRAPVPVIPRPTLSIEIYGKTVHVTGLIWGRLTTTLKEALLYDNTGAPTDCSAPGECKPVRAKLNGELKDGLMNDCLADALVYQGVGKRFVQDAMAATIGAVLDGARTEAVRDGKKPGPLIIVTESLGSKITFDALDLMLNGGRGTAMRDDLGRIAAVYMAANQLPILHLADLSPGDATAQPARAARAEALAPLLRVLRARPPNPLTEAGAKPIPVVAFTDPNDLLSYRLAAAGLEAGNVRFTDVLVSNARTLLGYVEHPWIAHTTYLENDDVIELIACGRPRSSRCKPR